MSEDTPETVAWDAWEAYWKAASLGDGAAMREALDRIAEVEPEVVARMRERLARAIL